MISLTVLNGLSGRVDDAGKKPLKRFQVAEFRFDTGQKPRCE
jgi:hypothetical protein